MHSRQVVSPVHPSTSRLPLRWLAQRRAGAQDERFLIWLRVGRDVSYNNDRSGAPVFPVQVVCGLETQAQGLVVELFMRSKRQMETMLVIIVDLMLRSL